MKNIITAINNPELNNEINKIKSEGYELTTPVIVINGDKYSIANSKTGPVKAGEILFDAIKMEA